MRQPHYPLTPARVQAHTQDVLQKHLHLKDHGPKCCAAMLWSVLLYAAARITSLAAACAGLRDAPSDTAVHDALLAGLPAFAQLQRRLNRALQGDLPKALRRKPQPLAIDLILIPYHGLHLLDANEIYRSQAKSGTTHFHAYATAYVIRKGLRFTVALTPVYQNEPLADVVGRLLAQAAKAGVRPRYLLLDRGFCSVEVIRYLQRSRRPFLMPVPKRGRKADHPKGPSGTQIFASWKSSDWGQYTMTNAAKQKATFGVCVKCRNRKGERGQHGREALVYAYGGGLQPTSFRWVQQTYRSRFAIETSYRQLHQARIRTTTRDPLLRLLYVGIALILRNVWVWLHWEVLAVRRRGQRRINLSALAFRQLTLWLQHDAEQRLRIREEIQVQQPSGS
jgi:Transposase DDE domain